MEANDLIAEDRMVSRRDHHLVRRPIGSRAKSAAPERLRCIDVARNRTARYARRHRVRKFLWPLITTAIVIGLVFERRPFFPLGWTGKPFSPYQGDAWSRSHYDRKPDDGNRDPIVQPSTADSSGPFDEEPKLEYRPPTNLLVRDIAQTIAFLIRNRGRLDNYVVQAKWKVVDEFSLPLALFFREVEANDDWSMLEGQISKRPLSLGTAAVSPDAPSSWRHRRILELIQEWQRRGEEMLASTGSNEPSLREVDDRPDDDDTSPKPTRR